MISQDKIERAIKMLRWAIDNKKTLTETTNHFKATENYFRKVKITGFGHSLYSEFLSLYSTAINKQFANVNSTNESDDLIDRNTIVEDEKIEFKEELKNTGVLDARGNKHVRTIDQLVKEAKIDLNVWRIDKHVINKWDVTNGFGQTYQNWQVKAWLSKNVEKEQAIAFDVFYKDLLKKHNPFKYKPVQYKKNKEQNLLEICVYDAHVGKLSWSEENRGEDYDIKIASKRFNEGIKGSIQRASGNDFDRILFVVGNDFFNSDTIINTTTSGTPQDEDTRWKKTYKLGFTLLVEAIDYMRQFAKVDVVVIPGNHDEQRSFFVGHSLESWYKNDSCVTIDNSAPARKYYRYGKVLLGLTHGNEEKEDRLPQLMAHEAKKDWADTDFHEWHLAHLHKKMASKYKVPIYNEDLGVVIRRLSSISGTDNWHFKKSYVGTQKAAEAFLWNVNDGLLAHFNINISY